MKLTEDNLKEYIQQAKVNDVVYSIFNDRIRQHHFIAGHERNEGFYAYNGADVTEAELISVYSVRRGEYLTTYDEAKEALFQSAIDRLKRIDKVYFKCDKRVNDLVENILSSINSTPCNTQK